MHMYMYKKYTIYMTTGHAGYGFMHHANYISTTHGYDTIFH